MGLRTRQHARTGARARRRADRRLATGRRDGDRGGAPIEPPIRVLVADDHAPTRAGVRLALEEAGFTVCAESGDGAGAVAAALAERPDVCLLDVNMPGGGIAATAEITARLPETAVVILTVSLNDADLFAALQAGASGYLLKDTNPARLPFALRGVLSGEAALPRNLVARVIEEFRERGKRPWWQILKESGVKLTSREQEVLELMREGNATSDIAEALSLSQPTVRSHIAAILKKLRVSSREEAVRLVRER